MHLEPCLAQEALQILGIHCISVDSVSKTKLYKSTSRGEPRVGLTQLVLESSRTSVPASVCVCNYDRACASACGCVCVCVCIWMFFISEFPLHIRVHDLVPSTLEVLENAMKYECARVLARVCVCNCDCSRSCLRLCLRSHWCLCACSWRRVRMHLH